MNLPVLDFQYVYVIVYCLLFSKMLGISVKVSEKVFKVNVENSPWQLVDEIHRLHYVLIQMQLSKVFSGKQLF